MWTSCESRCAVGARSGLLGKCGGKCVWGTFILCGREGRKSSSASAPWRGWGPLTAATHVPGRGALGELQERVRGGEEVEGPRELELQEKCK